MCFVSWIYFPALPQAWEWMEVRLPIAGQWTKIRYTKDEVTVKDCPLRWDYPNGTPPGHKIPPTTRKQLSP